MIMYFSNNLLYILNIKIKSNICIVLYVGKLKYIWAVRINTDIVNTDTEIEIHGGLNRYRTLAGDIQWTYSEKVIEP